MAATRLIFSSARTDSRPETVDDILRVSRTNNARDGVTGLLIVGEQQFVQLLEGDRASVSRCFLRIARDSRHRDLQVISTGEAPQRQFAGHSMQRIDLSDLDPSFLGPFLVDGAFRPSRLPQAAVEGLCGALGAEGRQADAGPDMKRDSVELERLRRLHRAARQVLDGNLRTGRLGRDTLERLQASVLRQAREARALQDRLSALGADEAQAGELADLVAYFDTIQVAIAQQLSQ